MLRRRPDDNGRQGLRWGSSDGSRRVSTREEEESPETSSVSTNSVHELKSEPDACQYSYLVGNFAPIHNTVPLTPCRHTGTIPPELAGGQYVRNGSNPVSNEDLGREAHWFDGDGMLTGVSFTQKDGTGEVQPEFVNQYLLTDLFLAALSIPSLRKPILPSIATLVNPVSSVFYIFFMIIRGIFLAILSRMPGSTQAIKKMSVANTAIMYHDGRALATCESGPPLRVQLPSLDTVGWYNGSHAEGEPEKQHDDKTEEVLGGKGLMSFMKEWTTAHPKVDPVSKEMVLFHSTFAPPYVHYSILPAEESRQDPAVQRLLNKAVAGVSAARMMHDFGVSRHHTIIMDLPLSLDPMRTIQGKPPIMYDSLSPSRFGVFPRHEPSNVRWFETSACCIFHTVNTWDVFDKAGQLQSVDMLACRMTSASVVFNAGNIAAPQPTKRTVKDIVSAMPDKIPQHTVYELGPELESPGVEHESYFDDPNLSSKTRANLQSPYEDEQCRLYYYSFSMGSADNVIAQQYALSAVAFEFPSTRPDREMQEARFVYGCTTIKGTFNSALGRDAKVDGLVKFDTRKLLERSRQHPPLAVTGCVDERSAQDVVDTPYDPEDPVQIYEIPEHYYAQEPRFVPSASGTSEDDGFLLTYMFDERQLEGSELVPPLSAFSELWIIDAKSMKDVVAKVQLPQRVPYGLHGNWFSAQQVRNQRPVERIRSLPSDEEPRTKVQRWSHKLTNGLVFVIGG